MEQEKKVYGLSFAPLVAFCNRDIQLIFCVIAGFTIAMYEYEKTIHTLWNTVKGVSSPPFTPQRLIP
jgi:hypothetical protein